MILICLIREGAGSNSCCEVRGSSISVSGLDVVRVEIPIRGRTVVVAKHMDDEYQWAWKERTIGYSQFHSLTLQQRILES